MPGINTKEIIRTLYNAYWTRRTADEYTVLYKTDFYKAVFAAGIIATRETARIKWLALSSEVITQGRDEDYNWLRIDLNRVRSILGMATETASEKLAAMRGADA